MLLAANTVIEKENMNLIFERNEVMNEPRLPIFKFISH